MQFDLVPHPSTPPADPPFKVWANVDYVGMFGPVATLNLWFGIDDPIGRFKVPEGEAGKRRDGLWRTTCFEAFLRQGEEAAYHEWNFAPSGEWAAYDFTARRDGMRAANVDDVPYIRAEDNLTWWALGATLAIPSARDWSLGLSAVIEEADGTRSYWALAHAGPEPDFHDPACFTARLG